ncbi:hypothetical protein COCCADRAFT_24469 [Bipolaris zeicola 26-R-13]|uniref:Cytochrome P450 n=1 Tax=Cochliobolus carbonum (strain 26-R-13) TaxID=930089 RepID=W6YDC1_COCC2|nr:uncharacterized protein COCCADRAFT_24469 [Bipolaris zeicola 26-R-13]EUC35658.1 hypothetical protein COCCADRAFT_24469 [Bipolaris zeicola 26-R-13]
MAHEHQFKNKVYRIAALYENDVVVLQPSILPELRKLGQDVLNPYKMAKQTMEAKYMKIEYNLTFLAHSVQADLAPALTRMNDQVCEEVEVSMNHYFPRCENPTPIQLYGILANIVTQVSGRIFVGPEIGRDPTYLDCAVNYAHEVTHVINAWMLARFESSNATETLHYVTKQQVLLTFAAIHTTTMVTTNILYTLAATTEYVPALREEISTVLAEHGGVPTPRALQQMVKLDSYMREVNRCYPPDLSVFSRSVLKPITLSNGQQIPTGVSVKVPSFQVLPSWDPNTDTDEFDGFRYYKQRIQASRPAEQARAQFVSSHEESLAWGYGRHACPGRFFAASEIKMLLIKFIMDYDISMPDGRKERYAQVGIGSFCSPDTTKALVFKRVVRS